jgi:hypothetical protein
LTAHEPQNLPRRPAHGHSYAGGPRSPSRCAPQVLPRIRGRVVACETTTTAVPTLLGAPSSSLIAGSGWNASHQHALELCEQFRRMRDQVRTDGDAPHLSPVKRNSKRGA